MSADVKETTTSQQRDEGVRRLVVDLGPHHRVQVEVNLTLTQLRDVALPDEPIRLKPTTEPVSNSNLAIALIRAASSAVTRVGDSL